MRESHYLFSNINFNSASALRMSILLLNSLKNLIIFFTIKPSLVINNNIILRMNISMSKNTESIDITNVCNIIIQKTPAFAQILLIN